VENLLIYPRIQGKTMQLHPAIAFGAALAGGALGGLMWAFLALPFAATVQASASLWIHRHKVEETAFVTEVARAPRAERGPEEPSPRGVRGVLRGSRGWLRRAARAEMADQEVAGTDVTAGEVVTAPAVPGAVPVDGEDPDLG
jgi:hypothetical protein